MDASQALLVCLAILTTPISAQTTTTQTSIITKQDDATSTNITPTSIQDIDPQISDQAKNPIAQATTPHASRQDTPISMETPLDASRAAHIRLLHQIDARLVLQHRSSPHSDSRWVVH